MEKGCRKLEEAGGLFREGVQSLLKGLVVRPLSSGLHLISFLICEKDYYQPCLSCPDNVRIKGDHVYEVSEPSLYPQFLAPDMVHGRYPYMIKGMVEVEGSGGRW